MKKMSSILLNLSKLMARLAKDRPCPINIGISLPKELYDEVIFDLDSMRRPFNSDAHEDFVDGITFNTQFGSIIISKLISKESNPY